MSHAQKNIKNVTALIAGIAAAVLLSIWQFYQFATFRNAGVVGEIGGETHLWWAIAMAVLACVAGVLLFSVFLKHDKDDELHITSSPYSSADWAAKK